MNYPNNLIGPSSMGLEGPPSSLAFGLRKEWVIQKNCKVTRGGMKERTSMKCWEFGSALKKWKRKGRYKGTLFLLQVSICSNICISLRGRFKPQEEDSTDCYTVLPLRYQPYFLYYQKWHKILRVFQSFSSRCFWISI